MVWVNTKAINLFQMYRVKWLIHLHLLLNKLQNYHLYKSPTLRSLYEQFLKYSANGLVDENKKNLSKAIHREVFAQLNCPTQTI